MNYNVSLSTIGSGLPIWWPCWYAILHHIIRIRPDIGYLTAYINKIRGCLYIWIKITKTLNMSTKLHLGWYWDVTLTSNHWNNTRIMFHDPKHPMKVVLLVILCLFGLPLQLTSNLGGGHIGFRKYGGPNGHSSLAPSEIETVWLGQHICQIWCFWKNPNQKSVTAPTIQLFT